MKKVIITFLLFTTIVIGTYSQELWNGINIGMSVNEAKKVLSERLGARDTTSNLLFPVNWSNEHIIYHGNSPTNMKSYYHKIFFMTSNPTYRQSGNSNITLYYNQNNIIIGIEIDWASTNFPNLLENTKKTYGEYKIVEKLSIVGKLNYYLWETDSRIIILTNIVIMSTQILDKKWYYENIYSDEEIENGINF